MHTYCMTEIQCNLGLALTLANQAIYPGKSNAYFELPCCLDIPLSDLARKEVKSDMAQGRIWLSVNDANRSMLDFLQFSNLVELL